MEKATAFALREIQSQDQTFLWEMLYEAAAFAESVRVLGKEQILALPMNRRYVEGWGRPGDAGVIAVDSAGQPLGAAWYRLYPGEAPGYGFISAEIPEIAIGVRAEVRGQGVGSAMLQALIELAHKQGYARLCLSVDRTNPALRLYERSGFRDAGLDAPDTPSVTMLRQ